MLRKILNYFISLVLIFMFILVFDIQCLIKTLIGIPCPGCGMTRAWMEVLSGEVSEAFKFHPLFLLAPILIVLLIVRIKEVNFKYSKLITIIITIIIVLFILVYIYRMIKYFPNDVPMDFNKDSLLYKITNLMKSL